MPSRYAGQVVFACMRAAGGGRVKGFQPGVGEDRAVELGHTLVQRAKFAHAGLNLDILDTRLEERESPALNSA